MPLRNKQKYLSFYDKYILLLTNLDETQNISDKYYLSSHLPNIIIILTFIFFI